MFSMEVITQKASAEPYDIGYAALNWIANLFNLGSEHLADHIFEKAMEILFSLLKVLISNRIAVFAAALFA